MTLTGRMFALTYAPRTALRGTVLDFEEEKGVVRAVAVAPRRTHGVKDAGACSGRWAEPRRSSTSSRSTIPEWGATAVAHELQIAKSQAHELLVSLAVGGLLQRVGAGRYRLGWRIVALNAVLVETSDLLRLVAPEMRALVGRYGETVHVAVWDGRPVCIDARSGRLQHVDPAVQGRRGSPRRAPRRSARCCSPAGRATRSTQFLSGAEWPADRTV